ncbi:large ribosomal subunit protein mL64-like [Haematobia irritans]|uniref:large ribosomal subunit protein mL64-like n=1 Tax=Haematobia irritans TaxID=7368 RepID=UPI003F4F5D0D
MSCIKFRRILHRKPIGNQCRFWCSSDTRRTSLENFAETERSNIEVSRNKSGLLQQHLNILFDRIPYKEPSSWIHLSEKYQRKAFARFGVESGVNPRICFHNKSDIQQQVYESLMEPKSVNTLIENAMLNIKQKNEGMRKREELITKNMERLGAWKKELQSKIAKKEADALAAKQRKERLVEEVRRHFGYKVDPRDERFKEVLEQKEKEDKKIQKEAKRQAKEQKLLSKLVAKS